MKDASGTEMVHDRVRTHNIQRCIMTSSNIILRRDEMQPKCRHDNIRATRVFEDNASKIPHISSERRYVHNRFRFGIGKFYVLETDEDGSLISLIRSLHYFLCQ